MELGVRDRNFVLVGGTTGMGFGAAHQLAADGANVALLARDEQRAAARAKLPATSTAFAPSVSAWTLRHRGPGWNARLTGPRPNWVHCVDWR